MSLLEAALWYAKHRVPVFPIRPRAKEPLVQGSFKAAATDERQIHQWWRQWPSANVAVPTGEPSGWLVVDIDPRNGGNETIEAWISEHGRWPDTAEAITGGGGRHIIFKHVPGLRCGPIAPGVDVKSSGGYIIVAPSIHPSGKRYEWDGIEGAKALLHLAEAPQWLLEIARRRQRAVRATVPSSAGSKIPRGRRNQELASVAGVLRARGADVEDLRLVLAHLNARLCDPPLEDDEVLRIAESIARYDPHAHPDDPTAQREFERLDEDRFVLRLPGIASELEVDRLAREGGALVGELTVRCWLPGARGVDGVVSSADFNLSSARARSERAKLIAARAGGKDVDWTAILEDLCQRVMAAERAGSPSVDLAVAPLPDEDEAWHVDGLPLLKHHPTILFGDGGSCKSLLALHCAVQLARRGVQVIYADWELDAAVHAKRLRQMCGDPPRGIHYVRCRLPLREEADALRRLARDTRAMYVVVDSAALACDGPPEAAESALRFFQALRRIGLGSLLIAHVSKAEGADSKPFGSVFWHNSCRSAWFVKRTEAVGGDEVVQVGLYHKKANLGRLERPLAFEIRFGEFITIRPAEAASVPELAERMTIAQRMAHLLKRGPMSVGELAETLNTEESSIRTTLIRKRGIFMKLSDGRVALLSQESSEEIQ